MTLPDALRSRLGTLLLDRPPLAWPALTGALENGGWVRFHNRDESLQAASDGVGVDCPWTWTTDLNIARSFPAIGKRILGAALADWPIELAAGGLARSEAPELSFIIGHRGAARIPHLMATLSSLASQSSCSLEVLVVEPAETPQLEGRLPEGVRWIHVRWPDDAPYNRAWTFNVGARQARGRVLAFHDNDVLAPTGYARELARLASDGYEAARLQRFVFYLTREDSAPALAGKGLGPAVTPLHVRQNCQGHTIAVTREAYFRMGGHDEGFVGWGGEDNEFFDRCRRLRFHPWGYLPFVHLHHDPQPTKADPATALGYLERVRRIPPDERIALLAGRPFGSPSGPLDGLVTP